MANVKYNYDGDLVDFFSAASFKIVSKSSDKAVFSVSGDDGAIRRIELEGTNFSYKSGHLTGGMVSDVAVLGSKNAELIEISKANIAATLLQDAFDSKNDWNVLSVLFSGNDKITTTHSENAIFTGAGDDVIKSTAFGSNTFFDGPGFDKYIGSTKNEEDTWLSYGFSDRFKGFGAIKGINADLQSGKIIDPWGDKDTVSNVYVVIGTSKVDKITGSDRDESFVGLGGKDTIDGGDGFDRIDFTPATTYGAKSGVTINLDKGFAIDSSGDRDTLRNFESARGSDFSDIMIGSKATEMFEGGRGDDKITGGVGMDVFRFRDNFGSDTITDFKANIDKLRVGDLSTITNGYDDVHLTQDGQDTIVTFEDTPGEIRLIGVSADTLSENDFTF